MRKSLLFPIYLQPVMFKYIKWFNIDFLSYLINCGNFVSELSIVLSGLFVLSVVELVHK